MKALLALLVVLVLTGTALAASQGDTDKLPTATPGYWQTFPFTPLAGLVYPMATDAEVLSANTAVTHPIPSWANYAVFSGSADFYVNFNGTAGGAINYSAEGGLGYVLTTENLGCQVTTDSSWNTQQTIVVHILISIGMGTFYG